MISYLSGPMLGNTQLGLLSSALGISRAIAFSSMVGLGGVLLCARLLKELRNYVAPNPRDRAGARHLPEAVSGDAA